SSAVSSKATKTPGSLNCRVPRTRNSVEKRVSPHPAAPQIKAGRPLGRPPLVISSKPVMPVGVLGSSRLALERLEVLTCIAISGAQLCGERYCRRIFEATENDKLSDKSGRISVFERSEERR